MAVKEAEREQRRPATSSSFHHWRAIRPSSRRAVALVLRGMSSWESSRFSVFLSACHAHAPLCPLHCRRWPGRWAGLQQLPVGAGAHQPPSSSTRIRSASRMVLTRWATMTLAGRTTCSAPGHGGGRRRSSRPGRKSCRQRGAPRHPSPAPGRWTAAAADRRRVGAPLGHRGIQP